MFDFTSGMVKPARSAAIVAVARPASDYNQLLYKYCVCVLVENVKFTTCR